MGGVLGIIGPVNSLIGDCGKVDLLDRGMMTIEYLVVWEQEGERRTVNTPREEQG